MGNSSYAADLEHEDFSRFLSRARFEHVPSSFRDRALQCNLGLISSDGFESLCTPSVLELRNFASSDLFAELDSGEALKFTKWFVETYRLPEFVSWNFVDSDPRFSNLYQPFNDADGKMTRSTACNTVNLAPFNAEVGIQVVLDNVVQEPFEPSRTDEYGSRDYASGRRYNIQLQSNEIHKLEELTVDRDISPKSALRSSNLSTLTTCMWEPDLVMDNYSVNKLDEIDGGGLETSRGVKEHEQDPGRTIKIPINTNRNFPEMFFHSEKTATQTEVPNTQVTNGVKHGDLSVHAPIADSSQPVTDYEALSNSSNETNRGKEPTFW
ncbi:unnamed protein product [Dibothriocephalus latus]|uniref:Uncharacterized protein n=1 Tax=Dibothriocephalus latus TaxID=60516 RepID=A0A3P6PUI3_DIBLA|nr:unnamed protein product [Dibothriocephalus latus]